MRFIEAVTLQKLLGIALLVLWTASGLRAQTNAPILSGGIQFLSSTVGGNTFFPPAIVPVLAVALGEHWLVESRADLRGFISHENGSTGPYSGQFIASLEYLQLDYIANSHVTVTVGRFLAPCNIYDGRFTPFWLRDLQDAPIIFPIGTRTTGSNNGVMFRGVIAARQTWEVNYTAYFSVLSTTENLQSGRTAGGRMGVFFPLAGAEVGVSYQQFLQDVNYNSVGTYFTWQPPPIPLDVRSEYAHSPAGQGYWLEAAYHFSKSRGDTSRLGRLQGVARVQQFFKGTPTPGADLPLVDINHFDFGLNYYLPHDVRVNGSYGRQYSSAGNANVWEAQISYRFLFPALPGVFK
jgi:hypothetical protein